MSPIAALAGWKRSTTCRGGDDAPACPKMRRRADARRVCRDETVELILPGSTTRSERKIRAKIYLGRNQYPLRLLVTKPTQKTLGSRNRPVGRVSGRANERSDRSEARPVKGLWTGETPSVEMGACPSRPSRSTGCAGMSARSGGSMGGVGRCPKFGHIVILSRHV